MQKKPTVFVFDMSDRVRVSPPMFLDGNTVEIKAGDLSKFTPLGNSVYGWQNRNDSDPFRGAPSQDARGGIIFFHDGISKEDFMVLMHVLGVQSRNEVNPPRYYAVFVGESKEPGKDGYLAQMRVVSRFGLRFLFGALTDKEYDKFPEQKLSIADALWEFMERERKRWAPSKGKGWSEKLDGLFGGDGDFAREELSFGFMVENAENHVYRIWSRAWLITK